MIDLINNFIIQFGFNLRLSRYKLIIYLNSMKAIITLALILSLAYFGSAENWAVLVAGSNTYANYRHQSDIYHAYQILIKNKFHPDRIITFAYDDLAHNIKNPFKGQIFNKPSHKDPGVDVYAGVKIDYTGKLVTPANFLAVMEGNKTAVSGKGTGRVLESTDKDNVFLYFSDHGAPGLIAFPNEYLHADKLLATFNKMKGHYNKFVFYLQACESGSMFVNLPKNTKIYALSAANPTQSSWGYYCSPDDVVQGKHIGSCLGDLFSINFLENTQSIDVNAVDLTAQFQVIQKLTTKSHVMQWGDLSFQSDFIGDYISQKSRALKYINLRKMPVRIIDSSRSVEVDSRFVKIRTLSQIFARQKTPQSFQQMRQQMMSMQRFDDIFSHVQQQFQLTGNYDPYKINHDCLRQTMSYFEQKCGRLSDYALIYVKYLAQACESISPFTIFSTIHC